ncbi:MAG TPA: hypothetical protein VEI57_16460, partial [Nitrospirota bacterium]|nr:hypothetical protein [Nitrospirota bacterium]
RKKIFEYLGKTHPFTAKNSISLPENWMVKLPAAYGYFTIKNEPQIYPLQIANPKNAFLAEKTGAL